MEELREPLFQYSSGSSNQYRSAFTYTQNKTGNVKISISGESSLLNKIITVILYIAVILTAPISLCFCVKIIRQDERLVIFRLGRLMGLKGPGVVIFLPCIDRINKVCVRAQSVTVPLQQYIAADGGIVKQGAEVWWRVLHPVLALTEVCDHESTVNTLVNVVSMTHLRKQTVTSLLNKSQEISQLIMDQLTETVISWGIEITQVILTPAEILEEPKEVSPLQPLLAAFQGLGHAQRHQHPETVLVNIDESKTKFDTSWRSAVVTHLQSNLEYNTQKKPIHLKLDVEGNGHLYITVADNTVTEASDTVNPDVCVTMSHETLTSLLQSTITPFSAWWNGLVKVEGDAQYLKIFGN